MPRFKGFSMDRRGKHREKMRGNRDRLGKGLILLAKDNFTRG